MTLPRIPSEIKIPIAEIRANRDRILAEVDHTLSSDGKHVSFPCIKCGSAGIILQFGHIANGTCFDCLGKGHMTRKTDTFVRARLRNEKFFELHEASRKLSKLFKSFFRQDTHNLSHIASQARLDALKLNTAWFGKPGSKFELENVKIEKKIPFVGSFGPVVLFIMTMDKFTFVWFNSGSQNANEGDIVKIKGTIKKHSLRFDPRKEIDVKQTQVIRIKFLEKKAS